MDCQAANTPSSLPSISKADARALLDDDHLEYFAWPELFGSTAGPFDGIGGRAMCVFTMEAWVGIVEVLVFCNGKPVARIPSRNFHCPLPSWKQNTPSERRAVSEAEND